MQQSFLSPAPVPLSLTVSLGLLSELTHLEQVTDHFKHLECGEAITLPSGHLQRPCQRALFDFEWALLYYPRSSHGGSRHSTGGVPAAVCDRRPVSLGIIFVLLVCGGIISTSRCHTVSYPSQQRRQEDGGADRGTRRLSVHSSQIGSLSERSRPSSISTLGSFPLHHSPSPICSSSQARHEQTLTGVYLCVFDIWHLWS